MNIQALPTALGEFNILGGRYAAVDYTLEVLLPDGAAWAVVEDVRFLPAGRYRHSTSEIEILMRDSSTILTRDGSTVIARAA